MWAYACIATGHVPYGHGHGVVSLSGVAGRVVTALHFNRLRFFFLVCYCDVRAALLVYQLSLLKTSSDVVWQSAWSDATGPARIDYSGRVWMRCPSLRTHLATV